MLFANTLPSGFDTSTQGKLHYTAGSTHHTIEFGKKTGLYAFGFLLNTETLPTPIRTQFQKKFIIQIVLGAESDAGPGKLPQFGTLAILTESLPRKSESFKVMLLNPSALKKGSLAILTFTSPQIREGGTEQERLADQFYGSAGFVTISRNQSQKIYDLSHEGEVFKYKKEKIKLSWNATLVTPFNFRVTNSLMGSIELPLYWPHNKAAEAHSAVVFASSFESFAPIPARTVATSPEKQGKE